MGIPWTEHHPQAVAHILTNGAQRLEEKSGALANGVSACQPGRRFVARFDGSKPATSGGAGTIFCTNSLPTHGVWEVDFSGEIQPLTEMFFDSSALEA